MLENIATVPVVEKPEVVKDQEKVFTCNMAASKKSTENKERIIPKGVYEAYVVYEVYNRYAVRRMQNNWNCI